MKFRFFPLKKNDFFIFFLVIAYPFFLSFITIIVYVMLNLFVLIIISDFETNHFSGVNIVEIFNDDLYIFSAQWAKFGFDEEKLKAEKLSDFFFSFQNFSIFFIFFHFFFQIFLIFQDSKSPKSSARWIYQCIFFNFFLFLLKNSEIKMVLYHFKNFFSPRWNFNILKNKMKNKKSIILTFNTKNLKPDKKL